MDDPNKLEENKPSTSKLNEQSASNSHKHRLIDELDLAEDGGFRGFGHYMQAKSSKLMHQIHDGVEQQSNLFKGLSFHVNGHTDPPGLELRRLIVENGGEWHTYYISGRTSYKIAMSLAISKWKSLAKQEIYLKPSWIVESIVFNLSAQTRLPIEQYKLQPNFNADGVEQSSVVEPFYERSRLHLISTLAQELKNFVADMRKQKEEHDFSGVGRLKTLVDEEGSSAKPSETPIVCHIDMDCFFVSVGLRSRPELRGKPVVVTHAKTSNPSGNADIASCSYEARKFQIQNGMWLRKAMKHCPDLICIPYEFENYRETSRLLYSIVARYTLDIKAISCDELYVDLTDLCTQTGISDPMVIVEEIRKDIFEETGCTASAGLGHSELVARLATRKAKPNGQFYVKKQEVNAFVKEIPLKSVPGIGYSLMDRLQGNFGQDISICKDLYGVQLSKLKALLGDKQGKKIYDSIRGISPSGLKFTDDAIRKSVSCDVNFGVRLKTLTDLANFIQDLSRQISKKLQEDFLVGSTLSIKFLIRCPDAPIEPAKYGAHGPCNVYTKSTALPTKTAREELIKQNATKMAQAMRLTITDIRGIGLQMTKLERAEITNMSAGIMQHLRPMQLSKQPSIQIANLPKKVPKNCLQNGQRYVKGRSIAKLPQLKSSCICSTDHQFNMDFNTIPEQTTILALQCFFRQFVSNDSCFEARQHYLELRESIQETEESAAKEEWLRTLEKLRNEINKEAQKRFEMLVLPCSL